MSKSAAPSPAVSQVRAAFYGRYSSDLQRAASIDDQLRNCQRRAEAEGWTITAEYADRAISGLDANGGADRTLDWFRLHIRGSRGTPWDCVSRVTF